VPAGRSTCTQAAARLIIIIDGSRATLSTHPTPHHPQPTRKPVGRLRQHQRAQSHRQPAAAGRQQRPSGAAAGGQGGGPAERQCGRRGAPAQAEVVRCRGAAHCARIGRPCDPRLGLSAALEWCPVCSLRRPPTTNCATCHAQRQHHHQQPSTPHQQATFYRDCAPKMAALGASLGYQPSGPSSPSTTTTTDDADANATPSAAAGPSPSSVPGGSGTGSSYSWCWCPEPLVIEAEPPAHFLFVLSDLRPAFPDQPHSYDLGVCRGSVCWGAGRRGDWVSARVLVLRWFAEVAFEGGEDQKGCGGDEASTNPFEASKRKPQQEAKVALEWLATFHAAWWEEELPEGLWEDGCYWHLKTRQVGLGF